MAIQTATKVTIVYQDPFSLKGLYKFIFWWLVDHGYVENGQGDGKGTSEQDLEIFYSEIVRSGGISEFEFWWRAEKPNQDPYFKYRICVDYLGLGFRDTEVVKNDKKYKVQIGEMTIRIMGQLITKYKENDSWGKKSSVVRYFKDWWNEKAYAAKTEFEEDFVIEDVNNLQNAIKHFLDLNQYDTPEDLFFKQKGFE